MERLGIGEIIRCLRIQGRAAFLGESSESALP